MKVTFAVGMHVKGVVGALLGWGMAAAVAAAPETAPVDAPLDTVWHEECASLLEPASLQHSVQLLRVRLHSQGLRLVPQGCPFVRTGFGELQQVLDVRVVVINSETAAEFVRGPLADGEPVDMGDVRLNGALQLQSLVAEDSEDLSPDVQHNRQWLAKLMQSQGWAALPAHWWAFVPSDKH